MKILNIILGLIYIVYDYVIYILNVFVDALLILFVNSKKDNEFTKLLSRDCFFINLVIFLSIFFVVALIDIGLAFLVTFISFFIVAVLKETYYESRKLNIEDDTLAQSSIITVVILILIISTMNVMTPYKYEKVGEIELTEKDAVTSCIKIDIDNKSHKVKIGNCKAGITEVYSERLEPYIFNYIKTDYVLSCSNEMKQNKKLKEIK